MEVMENVPDGEGYEAWRKLHHTNIPRVPGRCSGMLLDIMSHVFPEGGEHQQSALEVFEKKCRLYRSLSNEGVSETLQVAVVHRNLQDAELWKHLLRFAATLDSFSSIKDEVISCSLVEAAARGTAPMDVDQVNLVKGKRKKDKGEDGKGLKGKGKGKGEEREGQRSG